MANCMLSIELDSQWQGKGYRAGEAIKGVVEARVDEAMRCEGLEIEIQWETRGKGNRIKGEPVRTEVFQGEWRAETVERCPFNVEMPLGPISYVGEHLEVHWFLRATARVSGLDPKAEIEIERVADPEAEADWRSLFQFESEMPWYARAAMGDTPVVKLEWKKIVRHPLAWLASCGCLLPFLFMFGGLGLSLIEMLVGYLKGERSLADSAAALIFIALLLGGLGFVAVLILRRVATSRRLGEFEVEVEPRCLRPGQTLHVGVQGTPLQQVELSRAVATLIGRERVGKGGRRSKKISEHELFRREVVLTVPRTLQRGLPFQIGADLEIPEDAPPSFHAIDNLLRWEVSIALEMPRCPDWNSTKGLVVHP